MMRDKWKQLHSHGDGSSFPLFWCHGHHAAGMWPLVIGIGTREFYPATYQVGHPGFVVCSAISCRVIGEVCSKHYLCDSSRNMRNYIDGLPICALYINLPRVLKFPPSLLLLSNSLFVLFTSLFLYPCFSYLLPISQWPDCLKSSLNDLSFGVFPYISSASHGMEILTFFLNCYNSLPLSLSVRFLIAYLNPHSLLTRYP